MELFDVNCFLGRWPTEASATPDVASLRRELDRLGVQGALVRHTWGWWHDPLQALEGHPELRPCLAATPLSEDMAGLDRFLAELAAVRAGAVCLYPRAQEFSLSRWCAADLLDALEAASVPVILELQETSWDKIHEVLTEWPGLPVIVTRAGYRLLRYAMPLLRAHENLHFDIAYLADNLAIEHITEKVGAERLLFGTGTPRVDGSGALSRLMYSTITDQQREQIASGNAMRLLAGIRLPQSA
ncbi:MAG: amidohydrolase family protein [Anaerolineae bacterium]|jgi:predicted TIM-barrel fold metal-dependent hydrolase